MPKYIGLFNWTDAGVRTAKSTVDRYTEARALVERMGGSIDSIHWTIIAQVTLSWDTNQ